MQGAGTLPRDEPTDVPSTSTGQKRRSMRTWGRRLVPLAGLSVLLMLWEFAVRMLEVPTYLVPAPSDVADAALANRSVLVENAVPTLLEAGLGFLIGNATAFLLAIIFVHSDAAHRTLMPVAVFVRTIPIIAIAPVLVILFGYGLAPKVIIAALITFFPTLVNMVTGLRAVDPTVIELMHVLSASRWEILTRVRWFSALPYWFSALRVTATMSVLGAIVAEWVGARQGLGYLIIQTTYDLRTSLLYATMMVASIIALGGFLLVGVVERRVVRWETKKPTT